MEFNNKLYTLRKQKGFSQEELANRLNVSRQTISKWEVGESTPDLENLVAISELFEVSLDELAAAGNMSRSKCTKLFRQYVQQSPVEHIQNYRLERCIYLLNNTDMSCAEIAMNCGFNEQSYFNRLFLRKFNMTPKKMREQHQDRMCKSSQKQR
jgi:transcriptional regulator GlxA family with amidase domain